MNKKTSNTKSRLDPHEIIRMVAAGILENNLELSAVVALNLARIQFDLPVIAVGGTK